MKRLFGGAFLLLALASCEEDSVAPAAPCVGASCVDAGTTSPSALAVTIAGSGTVELGTKTPCTSGTCSYTYARDERVALLARPAAGHTFSGWSGDCSGQAPAVALVMNASKACTATFGPARSVSISVTAGGRIENGAGTVLCAAQTCSVTASGASLVLLAVADAGYRFTGWSGTGVCNGTTVASITIDPAAPPTCTANFARRITVGGQAAGATSTITAASTSAGAACTGASCTIDAGSEMTLTAPTVAGFRFDGWSGTGCPTAKTPTVSFSPTASTTCTGTYVAGIAVAGSVTGATGTVTATSTSTGAVCSAGSCTLDTGGTVTLTAPVIANTRFIDWAGDPGCTGTARTLVIGPVNSSRSCVARYAERITVTGTVTGVSGAAITATSPSAGASCTGATCTVDTGSQVTLDVTGNFGTVTWSGSPGCAGTTEPLVLGSPTANTTCTATLTSSDVTVTGAIAGAPTGTVTATSTAPGSTCANNTCTVTAGAAVFLNAPDLHPAYRFDHWSGTATGCSGTARYIGITTGTSDTTCTANYITWGCWAFCAGTCVAPVCHEYKSLVVDGTYAWYIRQARAVNGAEVPAEYRIMRAPIAGGAPTEFISSITHNPVALVDDGTYLYSIGGQLVRYAKSDGTATQLHPSTAQGFNIIREGTDLYFQTMSNSLARASADGTGSQVTLALRGPPYNEDALFLASDGTYLYFEDANAVKRVPLNSDGSAVPQTIAAIDSMGSRYASAVVSQGRLFATMERSDSSWGVADINLSATNDVVYHSTYVPWVAKDSVRAYWSSTSGGLGYTLTRGGTEQTLATSVNGDSFAIDATYVYSLTPKQYVRDAR